MPNKLKIFFFAAFLIVLIMGLTSCVYFNTYYNAKKYYKDAVKENIDNESGQVKTQNYNKSINSAARVLEYYPDSKYVDDALLIMCKSYYAIQSYPKAKRKCEELIANYPDSKLVYEARLYLGKTYIGMRQPEQGIAILNDLWLDNNVPIDVRLQSQRSLADYYFEKENYRQALLEYRKILEEMQDKSQRADIRFRIGQCYWELEDYESAQNEFEQVMDEKPTRKRQFDAQHKRAMCLEKLGDYETALKIIGRLLKKDNYYEWYEFAHLTEASIKSDLGQYDEAINSYERILELYPKTFTSAEAAYQLGIIYWKEKKDYNKAKEYLDRVQTEKRQSEFFEPASEIASDIQYLQNLTFSQDSLQLDIDTLETHLAWLAEHHDSLETDSTVVADSTTIESGLAGELTQRPPNEPEIPESILQRYGNPNQPGPGGYQQRPGMQGQGEVVEPEEKVIRLMPLPNDSTQVFERMSNDSSAMAEYRFRTAEHYWQRFNNADTAKVIFQDLATGDLGEKSPDVKARSLMSLYYIYKSESPDSTGPDSLLEVIHEDFPDTEYDNWVRPKLGLNPLPAPVDTVAEAFLSAEELWLSESRYADAVTAYENIVAKWPESKYAAKSQYAAAWLQERKLEDYDAAFASYDSLISWYPQSQYVSIAQKKIAPPPPEEPDSLETPGDTTATTAEMVDLGNVPPGVGPPIMLNSEDDLINYIHSNHLYPMVASEAEIPGEVQLTFVIDVDGKPKNFRIMRESPEGFDFGTQAIEAIKGMRFRPGYSDGQWIEAPLDELVQFTP